MSYGENDWWCNNNNNNNNDNNNNNINKDILTGRSRYICDILDMNGEKKKEHTYSIIVFS